MNQKLKRGLLFLLCAVLMCTFTACQSLSALTGQAPFTATLSKEFICPSYEGRALVLHFDVTNHGEYVLQDYDLAEGLTVTANGKTLSKTYLSGDECEGLLSSNTTVDCGSTGTLQVAYLLGDVTEGPVTVTLNVLNAKRTKSITVCDESFDLKDVEEIKEPQRYGITIDSAVVTDDGEGTDLLVLDYTFLNQSGADAMPYNLKLSAFQNAQSLKEDNLPYQHPLLDYDLMQNTSVTVHDGGSVQVRKVFALQDTTANVELKAVDSSTLGKEDICNTLVQLDGAADSAAASGAASSEAAGTDGAAPKSIVAEHMDVASNYSFAVDTALIGVNSDGNYEMILVGEFTNNSEESISFASALDAVATQGGYTMPTGYLSGTGDYNYNNIAPGVTIPVFLVWNLADDTNDISVTVTDSMNYAHKEVFSHTYTVDELVQNTKDYAEANDLFSEKALHT